MFVACFMFGCMSLFVVVCSWFVVFRVRLLCVLRCVFDCLFCVAGSLLFVVCCVLFVVLLFVVRCVLFVVCGFSLSVGRLFVVCLVLVGCS